jgi:hypothetical protein
MMPNHPIKEGLLNIESMILNFGSIRAVFQKRNNDSAVDLQEYFSNNSQDLVDLLTFLAKKVWQNDPPIATKVFFTGLTSSIIERKPEQPEHTSDGGFLGVLASDSYDTTEMKSVARNVAGSLLLLRDEAWDIGGSFFFWYIDPSTTFSLTEMKNKEWAQSFLNSLFTNTSAVSIFAKNSNIQNGCLGSSSPCFIILCWRKKLLFKLLSNAVLLLRQAHIPVYSAPLFKARINFVKELP